MFPWIFVVSIFLAVFAGPVEPAVPREKCELETDCEGKAACATIYENMAFSGPSECIIFQNDECITLNSFWTDEDRGVSSVDSHSTCVVLWEKPFCSGSSVRIRQGDLTYLKYLTSSNLGYFDDAARFISSCKRNAASVYESSDTYEECHSNDCSGKQACATIYRRRNFWNYRQCLTFENDECITLNKWWIGNDGDKGRVSSVRTHDTCIRLHYRPGCSGISIDILPDSPNSGYLNELNFEDVTRSVSSCKRPPNNHRCSVRHLFNKMIKFNEVSKASADVIGVLDGVASLAISGFSSVIPGLDVVCEALKFILGFFNSEKSLSALVDAKVEEAFARNSASQISAKIHVIHNRLASMLSPNTTSSDRRIDLGLALHTSEEVKKLFEDENYTFSQNKLVSSPYLIAFSSLYLAVAKLAIGIRHDRVSRMKLSLEMSQLARLNMEYYYRSLIERRAQFTCRRKSIADDLVCPPDSDDDDNVYYCSIYERDFDNNAQCEQCRGLILSSVQKEMKEAFQPVISKLECFPGYPTVGVCNRYIWDT